MNTKDSDSLDAFFTSLPKPAAIRDEITACHMAIKSHYASIAEQRARIKRLNRVLVLSEAEAGKVIRRPRKKRVVAESTEPMLPGIPASEVESQVEETLGSLAAL